MNLTSFFGPFAPLTYEQLQFRCTQLEERCKQLQSAAALASEHELRRYDDVVMLELAYPRCEENAKAIRVGLLDVRAADDILVSYDFERDGWSIKQASRFIWAISEQLDEDFRDVAFVPAWSRKETDEESEARMLPFEAKGIDCIELPPKD